MLYTQPAGMTSDILALFSDLAALFFKMVVPPSYRGELGMLAGRWKGFLASERGDTTPSGDALRGSDEGILRSEYFQTFLDSIDDKSAQLGFVHVLLPHIPYQFLPNGAIYETSWVLPGWLPDEEAWLDDEYLVAQGYQRYLLQVGFVDHLIGRFLDRLQALGIYDQSLIVITADHGVSFNPGSKRRLATPDTIGDILPIPLLIKKPGQRVGTRSDINAEIVDILPTIAEILDLNLPKPIEGSSLLNSAFEDRASKHFSQLDTTMEYPKSLLPELRSAVNRKYALFGNDEGSIDPYWLKPFGELLGRPEAGFVQASPIDDLLEIDAFESHINSEGQNLLVSIVSGRIGPGVVLESPGLIAVAVNGQISAITRPFADKDQHRFYALVSPIHIQIEKNSIRVYSLQEERGEYVLRELRP